MLHHVKLLFQVFSLALELELEKLGLCSTHSFLDETMLEIFHAVVGLICRFVRRMMCISFELPVFVLETLALIRELCDLKLGVGEALDD